MSSITDLPRLVYLDEAQVSQPMQLVHQGEVEQIVEEFGEEDGTTKGGGLNIYNVIRFELSKTSNSTENTAKTIRNTPLGKFAVYHGLVEDSDDLNDIQELNEESWKNISDKEFVTVTGSILKTPLAEIVEKFDEYDLWDGGDEEVAEQFRGGENYHQMDIPGEIDGRFVFHLQDEHLLPTAGDFPEDYTDYTIFGTVKHRYRPGQQKEFMSMLNDVPSGDRELSLQVDMMMKALSSKNTSDLLGRTIDESDYRISHPDIELSPIAIYL